MQLQWDASNACRSKNVVHKYTINMYEIWCILFIDIILVMRFNEFVSFSHLHINGIFTIVHTQSPPSHCYKS